jgi:hypothetical protein
MEIIPTIRLVSTVPLTFLIRPLLNPNKIIYGFFARPLRLQHHSNSTRCSGVRGFCPGNVLCVGSILILDLNLFVFYISVEPARNTVTRLGLPQRPPDLTPPEVRASRSILSVRY